MFSTCRGLATLWADSSGSPLGVAATMGRHASALHGAWWGMRAWNWPSKARVRAGAAGRGHGSLGGDGAAAAGHEVERVADWPADPGDAYRAGRGVLTRDKRGWLMEAHPP